jgi:DNA-directed RNA polymerase specialized sigma24 family protein
MSRSSGPGVQTVIAAQEGDEEALENLLSEYLPLIYNIVGRGLNGHADVDDVVQEAVAG